MLKEQKLIQIRAIFTTLEERANNQFEMEKKVNNYEENL